MSLLRSPRFRRPRDGRRAPSAARLAAESLERRQVLSGATGAVVTSLVGTADRTAVVLSFDGLLVEASAQDAGNYQVNAVGSGNPEFVTSTGAPVAIVAAVYVPADDGSSSQVTLTLAQPLALNRFYRVMIDGQPGTGLQSTYTQQVDGGTVTLATTFDGDADQTAAGDFYGLVAVGARLTFADRQGDTASIRVSGSARLQVWRQLNGDVSSLNVADPVPNRTVLSGSVQRGRRGDGKVALNSAPNLVNLDNRLPPSRFPLQAASTLAFTPPPVVATPGNLPYSLTIEEVPIPSVPTLQSAVSAQSGGEWLVFGGRTNGLHGFDPVGSFPRLRQNDTVYVIDPASGQTFSATWDALGVDQAVAAPLASTNQQFYQRGDTVYVVGGYSSSSPPIPNPGSPTFRTYDTLTAISVSGLIAAVKAQGSAVASIRQMHDPRLRVSGGDMASLGDRTYLVFGHDFQGQYNGVTGTADISQVYTSEVRSFRIVDDGVSSPAIADYTAQRDPVNFRRRDGNLVPIVAPNGRPGLAYLGGVFTVPDGVGYRNPVVIGADGVARVEPYQQFFSQYSSPSSSLYDARTRTVTTIRYGGISLYDYDFSTGILAPDTELPFVNDVTSLVMRRDGSAREYMMPSQLPGLYGAGASYLESPGLPRLANGMVRLRDLRGPTTLGYIYGGIVSTVPNTTNPATQTTASAKVFRVTLVPNV